MVPGLRSDCGFGSQFCLQLWVSFFAAASGLMWLRLLASGLTVALGLSFVCSSGFHFWLQLLVSALAAALCIIFGCGSRS